MDDNLLMVIGEIKGTQEQLLKAVASLDAKLDRHVDSHKETRHFSITQGSSWLLGLGAIAIAIFKK